MVSIDFVNNKLEKALSEAAEWISTNNVRVADVLVSEIYDDGFGAWQVRVYYERNA